MSAYDRADSLLVRAVIQIVLCEDEVLRQLEEPGRLIEPETMLREIDLVLLRVPGASHNR